VGSVLGIPEMDARRVTLLIGWGRVVGIIYVPVIFILWDWYHTLPDPALLQVWIIDLIILP